MQEKDRQNLVKVTQRLESLIHIRAQANGDLCSNSESDTHLSCGGVSCDKCPLDGRQARDLEDVIKSIEVSKNTLRGCIDE